MKLPEVGSMLSDNANFAIEQFILLSENCKEKWGFHDALFFAGTLATTIGYGSVTPETDGGKIFCIIFSMLGIPAFACLLKDEIKIRNTSWVLFRMYENILDEMAFSMIFEDY